MKPLAALYSSLLEEYGPQGWWPLPSHGGRRGFDAHGYHPGDFAQPRTAAGRFEIVLGALLTQNTAWTNAEKALARLREAGIEMPADVLAVETGRLAAIIRASGYFNQKARKLRAAARIFLKKGSLSGRIPPDREELLSSWGIGPETADSILLYAFRQPVFIIDAYTRRLFARVGLILSPVGDEIIRRLVHDALSPRHEVFNEFHALVVEHAKRHCRARALCAGCPVQRCAYRKRAAA